MASLSSLRVKWSTKNLSQTNPFNKNVFGLFIFVFLWNATNNLGVVCKFLQTDSIVTEEIEQRQPSVSIINAHHYPDHRYYLLQRKALRESDESGIENFDKNRQTLNFVTESFLDDRKRSTRNRDSDGEDRTQFSQTSSNKNARIVRRRQMKFRRSNDLAMLPSSNLSSLKLKNKKLFKKVIKYRKKTPMVTSGVSDNFGEYRSDDSFDHSLLDTPIVLIKREKIICLGSIKSNESDSITPKCFYTTENKEDSLENLSPPIVESSNSIANSESDLLNTEESSDERHFRHYIPPLIVPQTTSKLFLKRIGIFTENKPSDETKMSDDNGPIDLNPLNSNPLKMDIFSISTTIAPILERKETVYDFEENSRKMPIPILDQMKCNQTSSKDVEDFQKRMYLNVYEYPQSGSDCENNATIVTETEKSPEYYQLVQNDGDSEIKTDDIESKPNEIDQVDSIIILAKNDDRIVERDDSTTEPSIEYRSNLANIEKNQTKEEMTTSVKDLWQVGRRKKSMSILSRQSSENEIKINSNDTIVSTEHNINQQEARRIDNRSTLRIPKLLLPKVNRPAMYSLNGYVPKPSLQRPISRSNTTRKKKNRRMKNSKNKSKKLRKNRLNSKENSLITDSWSNLDSNKMTGKQNDYENDFDYDNESESDLIETSESIAHSLANLQEKRKILSKSMRKNLGLTAPKASLSSIPKTSFDCGGKRADGVYADQETGCQVWHICQNGQMHSFLCPIGTIFNSKNRVCDWWYNTACG